MQDRNKYDAIVVGSGISGGWAAKELTEKGLKTLVIERGKNIEHGDYPTEHIKPWQMPGRGRVKPDVAEADFEIQSMNYAFAEDTKHHFVNDRENPYIQVKPFWWIRGNQVGGRSLLWGRQCYRMSDIDFEANLKDGHGVDWPIRYADIEPWYDYVEGYVGISGQAEGLPQLPDGNFQKPMEMTAAEKKAKAGIEAAFPDRRLTIGRCAVLTEDKPDQGRAACHYCGPCQRGCSTGSYFSSQSCTLPAARKTGNMTLLADSHVHSVIYDEELDKATGVRVVNAETMELIEYTADVIFLCASTLGTTQILLNSKSPRFPTGLANSSGSLGHYVMDHHFQVGGRGTMPGLTDKYIQGNRPNGIYLPRFRNISADTMMSGFVRGYGFQGGGSRQGWGRANNEDLIGAELKEAMREPGPWTFNLHGFGEMLPAYENYADLDPEKTDRLGIPLLRLNVAFGENERAMRKDILETTQELLEAAGCTDITTFNNENAAPGFGIHEMGTARMGRDPKTSVLNGWNQAHDVKNLFVTDGSFMTSAGCQNPSITYMAMTARAVDYAVKELKAGNI